MSSISRPNRSRRIKLLLFYVLVIGFSWLSLHWLDTPRFRNVLDSPRTQAAWHYDLAVQSDVDQLWRRIEAALNQHDTKFVERLNGPATNAEIAKAEAALGYPLPGDVKASLKVHNGGLRLASTHDLHDASGIASLHDMYIRSCVQYPSGPLKTDPTEFQSYWHPGWAPVAGWDVVELIVNAESGSVYYWDEHRAQFQARSWKRWLENVARRLESGEFTPLESKWGERWTNQDKYHSPGAEETNGW
jgi:cell wall assembly regulator SMI1